MSTIVVVKKNGRACIAADSLTTWGSTLQSSEYLADNSKIIQVGDTYLGVAGSATHKYALNSFFLRSRRHLFRNRQEIFETWREMHNSLKDHYHLNPNDDKDDPYESSRMSVLIANPYGIFGVYSLRSVDEYTKYWAFGSGTDYALGALYCTYDRLENPEEIARLAVETAAEFDEATGMPITLYSVDLIQSDSHSNGKMSKPARHSPRRAERRR